jgi:putative transposase
VLSAKCTLHATPEQRRTVRVRPELAYCDALNAVSQYAFAHGKLSHQRASQAAIYHDLRARCGLPAQLACNVPRQV